MNINLIVTGKLKEKYLTDAQEYFLGSIKKRKNINIRIFELADLSMSDSPSPSEEMKTKDSEGEQVIKLLEREKLKSDSFITALDLSGEKSDLKLFSKISEKAELRGKSSVTFIIGGSLGNSVELLKRADLKISMSKMTYPHQLFRIALLEIIERHF